MSHSKMLKKQPVPAIVKSWETKRDRVFFNLQNLLANHVGIGEHVDLDVDIERLLKECLELDHLVDQYKSIVKDKSENVYDKYFEEVYSDEEAGIRISRKRSKEED